MFTLISCDALGLQLQCQNLGQLSPPQNTAVGYDNVNHPASSTGQVTSRFLLQNNLFVSILPPSLFGFLGGLT